MALVRPARGDRSGRSRLTAAAAPLLLALVAAWAFLRTSPAAPPAADSPLRLAVRKTAEAEEEEGPPAPVPPTTAAASSPAGAAVSTTTAADATRPSLARQYDFEAIGRATHTDKVLGPETLAKCLADPGECRLPEAQNPRCRTGANHFYHTMYNARLAHLARDDAAPFQMLEIGFFNGNGYDAFRRFMPRAEAHSLEISCIPEGPRDEGKWPYGNFAAKHKDYEQLRAAGLLHCGDASDYDTLLAVWRRLRARPDAPPLKLVIDDGAHLSRHMAISVFFWFPRLAPGGLLVVEDIQPTRTADTEEFRRHLLPQLQKDVHFCGDPRADVPNDRLCFPTLHRFLRGVHCEMHICVLERNEEPAVADGALSREESLPPPHVFDAAPCLFGTKNGGGGTAGGRAE